VCGRPLRGRTLCFRCTPPLPSLEGCLSGRCPHCFDPVSLTDELCPACSIFPLSCDSTRYLWNYGGLARDLIRSMKYRPSIRLARLGGTLLAQAIPHLLPHREWDLIVPVPSSAQTYRKRLFHPCEEMAHAIAGSLHLPVKLILTHDRKRPPQAKLLHDARLRNLRGLFSVTRSRSANGARILLVEDVITTGATIAAATHTLKQAGALRVDVIALARSQSWLRFRERVTHVFTPKTAQKTQR
jgi:predicted amidophosphoribosyltransferase